MPVRSELKVGIIVIQSLVALALVIYFLSIALRGGYIVRARFRDAMGIDKGSIVRMAGVQIGVVDDVYLDDRERPVVRLRIQPDKVIYTNYKVTIATGALIGEKYIQITPAVPAGEKVEPGGMIAGTDQVQLEKIMAQVSGLIQDFQTTTRSFNKLLENEEINRNRPLRERGSWLSDFRWWWQRTRAPSDILSPR